MVDTSKISALPLPISGARSLPAALRLDRVTIKSRVETLAGKLPHLTAGACAKALKLHDHVALVGELLAEIRGNAK